MPPDCVSRGAIRRFGRGRGRLCLNGYLFGVLRRQCCQNVRNGHQMPFLCRSRSFAAESPPGRTRCRLIQCRMISSPSRQVSVSVFRMKKRISSSTAMAFSRRRSISSPVPNSCPRLGRGPVQQQGVAQGETQAREDVQPREIGVVLFEIPFDDGGRDVEAAGDLLRGETAFLFCGADRFLRRHVLVIPHGAFLVLRKR